jgi:hypothetical protein
VIQGQLLLHLLVALLDLPAILPPFSHLISKTHQRFRSRGIEPNGSSSSFALTRRGWLPAQGIRIA